MAAQKGRKTAASRAKPASKKKKIARPRSASKSKGGNAAAQRTRETRRAELIPAELQVTPDEIRAKDLSPDIRGYFDRIVRLAEEAETIVVDARRGVLKKHYDIGGEVNELLASAAETGDSKANLERLAAALGVTPRNLRNAGNVAVTIPPDEFDGLCCHPGVSWSHLVVLSTVTDPQTRTDLVARYAEKNLGVRELADAARDASPKKQRGPGRRRHVPVSAQTALRQMGKACAKLTDELGDIYFGKRFDVAKAVKKLKPADINPALREEAQAALRQAEALQDKLAGYVDKLRAVVEHTAEAADGSNGKAARGKQRRQRRRA